jgi:hypothetical protein
MVSSTAFNGKVMRPEFHSRQARAVDADALADNGVFQVLIVRNAMVKRRASPMFSMFSIVPRHSTKPVNISIKFREIAADHRIVAEALCPHIAQRGAVRVP